MTMLKLSQTKNLFLIHNYYETLKNEFLFIFNHQWARFVSDEYDCLKLHVLEPYISCVEVMGHLRISRFHH